MRDVNPFSGAKDIANRYRQGNYDDIVTVAPAFVIKKLTELGIYPLWAEMKQVEKSLAETNNNGRYYTFVEFHRIKKVGFEFFDTIDPIC